MTEQPIPAAIQAFVDTTNAGDSEGFVASFALDAYLNDWGREFHGRDGVAAWNRTDNIGVQAHFELLSVTPAAEPDSYTAMLTVSGNGYNGTGPMAFQLHDGLIAALRIS
jgi:SnoaL-like domain